MYNYLHNYINSKYFDILNLVSGFNLVIKSLESDSYLSYLLKIAKEKRTIQKILNRIEQIKNIEIERKYKNPFDIELTVLLWCLFNLKYKYEDSFLDNIENLFWAKKMEEYIKERESEYGIK